VLILARDRDLRIITENHGELIRELIRELVLDPPATTNPKTPGCEL
jgi:hypothetical protein